MTADEIEALSPQEAFWHGVRLTLRDRTTALSEENKALMFQYTDHLQAWGGPGKKKLPIWDVHFEINVSVSAVNMSDALQVGHERLRNNKNLEIRYVNCVRKA